MYTYPSSQLEQLEESPSGPRPLLERLNVKAEEESLEAEILEVYSSVLIKCKKLRRVNYWLDFFLTKKNFLNPHQIALNPPHWFISTRLVHY